MMVFTKSAEYLGVLFEKHKYLNLFSSDTCTITFYLLINDVSYINCKCVGAIVKIIFGNVALWPNGLNIPEAAAYL
jgi:hypothetical protein